ncbi:MAG TPA: TRAP transporter large permease subunit, partial [Rhodocyclaceae bacterium]|nr:TRAP transporter large permease subunit [Rhodocyclaceae bacterium]
MATLIALVLLLILLSCGVQIAVALGLISALLIAFHPAIPAAVLADVAIGAIDKYVLLAIPLFIFAGTVVTKGDVAARIIALVETLVRPVRGAMALTAIIGGVFFAAVNGSSVAGAVALGPSLMTTLPAQGYPKRFVAALTAVASTVGLMIPPSLSFILIGSLMELSIVDLFVAGLIPGLVESLLLGVATLWMAHRHQYGLPPQPIDVREFGRRLPPALAALAMPVVIIGTIYAGLFTPTEVAAVAALYAAVLVGLIYRNVGFRDICGCARETVLQTAMIFMLLVSASLLTFVLTRLGLARDILEITHRIDPSPLAFLLFVNGLLLVLGTVFD